MDVVRRKRTNGGKTATEEWELETKRPTDRADYAMLEPTCGVAVVSPVAASWVTSM